MPKDEKPSPIKNIDVLETAKRIRAVFNGETVADSLGTLVMLEPGHHPVYYFPRADVRMDLMRRTDHSTTCRHKGDASYWTLAVGGREAENAVWSYEDPIPNVAEAKEYIAFYWDRMDSWLEEDDEIFGHPRNPRVRVDIRNSSRPVKVTLGGETLAESGRGRFLFETRHRFRPYLPQEDIRMDLLVPSETRSHCPYKGDAVYWSARIGNRVVDDVAWSYPAPFDECLAIKDYLCFYDDRVDSLTVDGKAVS